MQNTMDGLWYMEGQSKRRPKVMFAVPHQTPVHPMVCLLQHGGILSCRWRGFWSEGRHNI